MSILHSEAVSFEVGLQELLHEAPSVDLPAAEDGLDGDSDDATDDVWAGAAFPGASPASDIRQESRAHENVHERQSMLISDRIEELRSMASQPSASTTTETNEVRSWQGF